MGDALSVVEFMLLPRFVAALPLALVLATSAAQAETRRAPLALTLRPSLAALQSFAVPGASRAYTLTLRDVPAVGLREAEARASSDEMYAPLRGVWTGIAERCGARICDTESGPKTNLADEALAQLGVVSIVLSAFVPKGEVFSVRSELTGQKIRFTPTTFSTTGAGLRVWGTF